MPAAPAHIYFLHGEDEFGIALFLLDQAVEVTGLPRSGLNISRLDGRTTSFDRLRRELGSMPMFSARNMVVIEHVGSMASNPSARETLITILDRAPETTLIYLVEEHIVKNDHWLIVWANRESGKVLIRTFPLKKGDAMERWIAEQAQKQGGKFGQGSAATLASLVGSDARLANQEIGKLITYCGPQRVVLPEDVLNLCGYMGQANIFALVDALGGQDGKRAQDQLHKLLREDDPRRIFGMVVRQFRLLLLAKEIINSGGRVEEVAKDLGLAGFVAEKLVGQARKYSMSQLEFVYHRLLEWDEAIKSGLYEDEIMLETIAVEFTSHWGKSSH
jgi:DNA polymerase-3 subunit delta